MPNPIAFSTLGCPTWDMPRVLSAVTEYGYDAVELRGFGETLDLPLAEPFLPGRRAETKRRFADAGAAICCVSSSGIAAKGNNDHVRAHTELARDLGCPIVRVFGGALDSDVPRAEALARAAANLRRFGDAARDCGVSIVLETHDSFSTGRTVAELIAAADHPAVRSLWDLHHPFREGEPIDDTYAFLGPTLAHLHIKDSRSGGQYCLLGEGDIPIFPMLDRVLDGGYTGAISLEWEKRWHPEIADPEVAFPQYARVLRAYLDSRPSRT
jgi:sugar phosphate isomerase/epimerase